MKRILLLFATLVFLAVNSGSTLSAQGLLKKATKKLQKEAEKLVSDDEEEVNESPPDNPVDYPSDTESSSGSSGAKKMTPPDVRKNISSAESAYSNKNYDNTRFAVQQALMGVELEIGYEILNSLPTRLSDMDYYEENDHVNSTGIGFAGLQIERYYNNDKQDMDLQILNNSGMLGAMSSAMANPMYTDESQKAVMVGGYKGLLELRNEGYYTLGIPIGQSSLISMSFHDFDDDESVIAVAEEIDIDKIKSLLGEQ
jgi:hypothetical protein